MKYVIIFVADRVAQGVLPGQMFEYDKADTLEEANEKIKTFNSDGGHILILPYYEVEK